MKKLLIGLAMMGAAGSVWANADIEVTSVSQDPVTRLVRIDYTLGYGPAILTLSVARKSTGEAIPGTCVGTVSNALEPDFSGLGLVNDGEHTIFWRAQSDTTGDGVELAAGELQVKLRAWDPLDPPPYMLVDLNHMSNRVYAVSADELPFGNEITNEAYRLDWMVFRRIPARNVTWRMGSPEDEPSRSTDSYRGHETCHYVTLEHDYYLGVFPVTRGQYLKMTGGTGPDWSDINISGDERFVPADKVSLETLRGTHANGACLYEHGRQVASGSPLARFRTFTGIEFDLPTEAQWEFACRGGCGTAYNNGTDSIGNTGWYNNNSRVGGVSCLREVGLKDPNSFGLYDMHGNVMELCPDVYVASVSADSVTEPVGGNCNGASAGNMYITKGGSYDYGPAATRAATTRPCNHGANLGMNGFRLWCQIGE